MYLVIKTSTWIDDKNTDMYCYSSQQLNLQKTLKVSSAVTLFRHKKIYDIFQENHIRSQNIQNYEQLITIQPSKKGFFIVNSQDQKIDNNKQQQQYLYSVCTEKTEIKQGDMIRLGKSTLKVNRIKVDKKKKVKSSFFQQNQLTAFQPSNQIDQNFYNDLATASTIQEAPSCRYCYSKTMSNSNPLMTVCNCQGTTKYVHKKCLEEWVIMQTMYIENKESGIYCCNKKGTTCEICNKQFDLVKILPCFRDENFNEYLQLTKTVEQKQTIYFIALSIVNQLRVGRKIDNQISMENLSVSRLHCTLSWDQDSKILYIEDNQSKFGTLIKKSLIQVKQGLPCSLQRGRTKLQLKIMKKKKSRIIFFNK